MAADPPPKQILDGVEALRAIQGLHASRNGAGSLRIAFGTIGADRQFPAAPPKPAGITPQP